MCEVENMTAQDIKITYLSESQQFSLTENILYRECTWLNNEYKLMQEETSVVNVFGGVICLW